jgi:hypothetical protein
MVAACDGRADSGLLVRTLVPSGLTNLASGEQLLQSSYRSRWKHGGQAEQAERTRGGSSIATLKQEVTHTNSFKLQKTDDSNRLKSS